MLVARLGLGFSSHVRLDAVADSDSSSLLQAFVHMVVKSA